MRHFFILIIAAMAFSLPIMGQSTDPAYAQKLEGLYKHSVPILQPAQFAELRDQGKDLLVLDTRSQKEFAVSHIDGAIFVDYDSFGKRDLAKLPKDKTVVVYCTVGYRSERIGEQLKKAGMKEVFNLYGGIFEWVNQGHPVVDANGKSTDKVHAYSEDWGLWLKKGKKVY